MRALNYYVWNKGGGQSSSEYERMWSSGRGRGSCQCESLKFVDDTCIKFTLHKPENESKLFKSLV